MAQNLSNLAVGAKVKLGKYQVASEAAQDIIWVIAAKAHSSTPAYPTNAITLLTEKIIDLRCFDAKEPSNADINRKSYGNNRYNFANLDQWLNKNAAAGAWYAAAHAADQAPDAANVDYATPYDTKAGFLNLWTDDERNAIQNTTLRVVIPSVDGGGSEDIVRKVFLPSSTEVGLENEGGTAEGALWSLFSTSSNRIATLTQQAFSNSPSTSKPSTVASAWYWWLRTPRFAYSYSNRRVNPDGSREYARATHGFNGVRPALNLLSSLLVSDTTDSDGCYTFVWNAPPTPPSSINVPASIYGGKTNVISWGASTDPDGNLSGYSLERAYNGGSFSTIYTGANLTYTDTVEYGKTTVRYRVRAYDAAGAYSTYTTSAVRSVINNQPPVISGSDANLGTKTTPFTQTYVVTDADADAVTVVERIDGVLIRSYSVVLDATNTFSVTGATWLKQTNGTHSMTVTASDSYGNNTVRTYTFTKNVTSFSILTAIPMESSAMPTRLSMSISRNIPPESTFLVEVCNNGFDASPTWEDATSAVISNFAHVFGNTTKTAASWGVSIRITVNRNGASGACYVNAIGGNFE